MPASARERMINEKAVNLHRALQGYLGARDSLENVQRLARQFLSAVDGTDHEEIGTRRNAAYREYEEHLIKCERCRAEEYCAVKMQLYRTCHSLDSETVAMRYRKGAR